jgi:hypothetical protein
MVRLPIRESRLGNILILKDHCRREGQFQDLWQEGSTIS